MKHFYYMLIAFLLIFLFFDSCTLYALEFGMVSQGELFSNREKKKLEKRYREASSNGDIQLKKNISEEIGELGAEKLAKKLGMKPIMTKKDKSIGHPQGYDQVHRTRDGRIALFEAKGGDSYRSMTKYGMQGSPEWAANVAEKTQNNRVATVIEKNAAKLVEEAKKNGTLDIYMAQTEHVQGKPGETYLKKLYGDSPSSSKIAGKAPKTIASTSKGFRSFRRVTNMTGKAVQALAAVDIGVSAYSFLNDLSIANQQNELDPDLFIERSAITSSAHIGFDVTTLYFIPATPDLLTGFAIAGGLIATEFIVEKVIDNIFYLIQAHREWLRQIEEERVRNVSRLIQKHTVYKQHECIAIILRQMALEL